MSNQTAPALAAAHANGAKAAGSTWSFRGGVTLAQRLDYDLDVRSP